VVLPMAQNLEIRTENLYKSFGDKSVLQGLNLDVQRGQMVAIIGGSGSGKTTLLKLLTAQEQPDKGRVLVADHETPGSPLIELAKANEGQLDRLRRHWAVVFQSNALFSGTVYDNLAFAFRDLGKMDEVNIRGRIERAIQSVELDVKRDLQLNVDDLSGGMAKRVAIARALVLDPILIFYDEPTSGLDPILTTEIQALIRAVHLRQPEGNIARTSIIITHDRDLLLRLQPRIIMLHEGRTFFDGTYNTFSHSDSPVIRPYYEFMPALQERKQTSALNVPE
jgi:phospholipid/cholesterol/gamma-HCH transport system ATP-binding protein